jgi:protein TonB
MRLALFLIVSVSLHVAALAYPVTFARRYHGETIRVTILPEEPESIGGGGGGESSPAPQSKSVSPNARPSAAPDIKAKVVEDSGPEQRTITVAEVETVNESSVTLISAIGAPSIGDSNGALASTDVFPQSGGVGARGTDAGGNGFGIGIGSGNGNGVGSGAGPGGSGNGVALTQARYRDTPRPEYPESARRQGREGRVLLRVLVDDQGRSKRVEINSSSGSDALDRAAVEAIKRWRFHPARHADKSIESWLRVPIEFRLHDANTR